MPWQHLHTIWTEWNDLPTQKSNHRLFWTQQSSQQQEHKWKVCNFWTFEYKKVWKSVIRSYLICSFGVRKISLLIGSQRLPWIPSLTSAVIKQRKSYICTTVKSLKFEFFDHYSCLELDFSVFIIFQAVFHLSFCLYYQFIFSCTFQFLNKLEIKHCKTVHTIWLICLQNHILISIYIWNHLWNSYIKCNLANPIPFCCITIWLLIRPGTN